MVSFMKRNILLPTYWKKCSQMLRPTNGDLFKVTLKSKPVTFKLITSFQFTATLYGINLLGKDVLVGFDISPNLKNVWWTSKGMKIGGHMLP